MNYFKSTNKKNYASKLAMQLALALTFVLLPFCLNAQNEEISTLFGGNRASHIGYFAAPEIRFSQVDNQFATFLGGRAGVIFNRTFAIGLAGYILTELPKITFECPRPEHAEAGRGYLEGGYGGLFLEYIHNSTRAVHFTANMLVGLGGLEIDHERDRDRFDHDFRASLVVEPGATVVFNISRMFRVAAGVGYRFAPGFRFDFEEAGTRNTAFNGFSANLSFKVGVF